MPKEEDLIRVAGAARLAGASEGTVRRWITEGRLSKYVDGRRRVWVDRNEVLRMIEKRPAGVRG